MRLLARVFFVLSLSATLLLSAQTTASTAKSGATTTAQTAPQPAASTVAAETAIDWLELARTDAPAPRSSLAPAQVRNVIYFDQVVRLSPTGSMIYDPAIGVIRIWKPGVYSFDYGFGVNGTSGSNGEMVKYGLMTGGVPLQSIPSRAHQAMGAGPASNHSILAVTTVPYLIQLGFAPASAYPHLSSFGEGHLIVTRLGSIATK